MATADRPQNRYALLDVEEPIARKIAKKQNRRGTRLTDLPSIQESFADAFKEPDPKYVIVSLADEKRKITDLNPFVVCKMIEYYAPTVRSCKALQDGTYLVFLPSKTAAEKLVRDLTEVDGQKVKVTYHGKLNSSKGTAYAPNLKRLTEEEILQGLKDKNKTITEVKKMTRTGSTPTEKIPTGALQITFDRFAPPSSIVCCLENLPVRRWYPAPLRCRNCYQFRHHETKCKNTSKCWKCGQPKAQAQTEHECKQIYCIGCETEGDHSTLDRICPSFESEKAIVKIQVDNHITRYEARKQWYSIYGNLAPVSQSQSRKIPGLSYADAFKTGGTNPTNTANTNSLATENTNSRKQNTETETNMQTDAKTNSNKTQYNLAKPTIPIQSQNHSNTITVKPIIHTIPTTPSSNKTEPNMEQEKQHKSLTNTSTATETKKNLKANNKTKPNNTLTEIIVYKEPTTPKNNKSTPNKNTTENNKSNTELTEKTEQQNNEQNPTPPKTARITANAGPMSESIAFTAGKNNTFAAASPEDANALLSLSPGTFKSVLAPKIEHQHPEIHSPTTKTNYTSSTPSDESDSDQEMLEIESISSL